MEIKGRRPVCDKDAHHSSALVDKQKWDIDYRPYAQQVGLTPKALPDCAWCRNYNLRSPAIGTRDAWGSGSKKYRAPTCGDPDHNPTMGTANKVVVNFKPYRMLYPDWTECDWCKGSGYETIEVTDIGTTYPATYPSQLLCTECGGDCIIEVQVPVVTPEDVADMFEIPSEVVTLSNALIRYEQHCTCKCPDVQHVHHSTPVYSGSNVRIVTMFCLGMEPPQRMTSAITTVGDYQEIRAKCTCWYQEQQVVGS